jgi:hypothetical protein
MDIPGIDVHASPKDQSGGQQLLMLTYRRPVQKTGG